MPNCLWQSLKNVPNPLTTNIVDAQIRAASGEQTKAIQSLSTTAHDVGKYGFVVDQLEARLARADIELNSCTRQVTPWVANDHGALAEFSVQRVGRTRNRVSRNPQLTSGMHYRIV